MNYFYSFSQNPAPFVRENNQVHTVVVISTKFLPSFVNIPSRSGLKKVINRSFSSLPLIWNGVEAILLNKSWKHQHTTKINYKTTTIQVFIDNDVPEIQILHNFIERKICFLIQVFFKFLVKFLITLKARAHVIYKSSTK